jgi:hypothetical protein
MPIHQLDRSVFLVEYPGLPRQATDVGSLADGGTVSDTQFGAELKRLLHAAMESTPEASWVRERGYAVKLAPTEPHRGRLVFRMTFADEDEAMLFGMTWADIAATEADARRRTAVR